ncbi:hypothetical protein [Enterococcus lemanii]|uniref:Uncharacterized protein n=1 Tax=Enterococcus lemanii TaxID=1159752 RepID=A0ABV9MXK8_9ENTE|nr:hypothetical protein [Enterococcus lemanii]MBM7708296.1 TusA-related sulfurtransferase [Enterococcus lemanii]NLM66257.1 hypothetical protein [Enterococcus sp.]
MSERNFIEELQQLRDGEITEIIVKRDEFISFREVWLTLENREAYVGEAELEGTVVYRYVNLNK